MLIYCNLRSNITFLNFFSQNGDKKIRILTLKFETFFQFSLCFKDSIEVCDPYANHGACSNGDTCSKSHDIDRIVLQRTGGCTKKRKLENGSGCDPKGKVSISFKLIQLASNLVVFQLRRQKYLRLRQDVIVQGLMLS